MRIRAAIATLAMLLTTAVDLRADLPLESPDRTATRRPAASPLAGRWRRTSPDLSKEFLIVSDAGEVRFGERDRERIGRARAHGRQTVEIDLRTQFGQRRLECWWNITGDTLVLKVLESRSRTDERERFQALDEDRSLEGQTWFFRRGR